MREDGGGRLRAQQMLSKNYLGASLFDSFLNDSKTTAATNEMAIQARC